MRKLALLSGAFSAAVFAWRYGLWPLAAAAAILCLPGLFLCRGQDRRRIRLGLKLILTGLVTALAWCTLFSAVTLGPWEDRHREKDVVLTARIDGWPSPNGRGELAVEARFTDGETGRGIDGLLYLPLEESAAPGDVLQVRGTLYIADWVGEEELTTFSSRGVFVRVYAAEVLERGEGEGASPRYWPLRVSALVKGRLDAAFDAQTAPLATALVLGDKSGLSDHFLAMSRRAGLAHVIVISGMHVSFLAGLMTLLVGRRTRWGAGLTLLLLCFFALMAGGTPSVWRAVILCGAGLLAPLTGRENDPPTALLAALMLLLVINPYAAASVGLQLSFASVAGIQLLTPGLLKRWVPKRPRGATWPVRAWWRFRAGVASGLAVTLGAILLTTPLTAWYFGAVSLIGPVSNLLALWAVSACFLLSVLAAAMGFLLPLGAVVLAWPAGWLLRWLLWLVPALGSLPFASVTLTSPYYALGLVALYAMVCLNLFWPAREKKRLGVPLVCGLTLAAVCVVFTRLEFVLGDMTVAVLDVGQGQSVCIRLGGRTILVDCGGDPDAGDVAADYLADQGIGTVDLLVLTHCHADHAGGVPELMERLEVRAVALPDRDREARLHSKILALAEKEGAQVSYITSNTVWPMGEKEMLTLYAPLGDGGSNERGLSVLATAGDYDVLLTGDMNSAVEERLVKYGNLPDIELLVVGHHGSRYSTGEMLLQAVRPETAVISVGRNNGYGHPAQETLERLAQRNIAIYRTDLSGTVVVHRKGG